MSESVFVLHRVWLLPSTTSEASNLASTCCTRSGEVGWECDKEHMDQEALQTELVSTASTSEEDKGANVITI